MFHSMSIGIETKVSSIQRDCAEDLWESSSETGAAWKGTWRSLRLRHHPSDLLHLQGPPLFPSESVKHRLIKILVQILSSNSIHSNLSQFNIDSLISVQAYVFPFLIETAFIFSLPFQKNKDLGAPEEVLRDQEDAVSPSPGVLLHCPQVSRTDAPARRP